MDETKHTSLSKGEEKRSDGKDEFSGSCHYVVSLLGQSLGISDFWRFPYLVYRNGGGAFLIPFIVTMMVCGLPLFFLEVAMSQFSGKGPMNLWQMSPFFKGVGFSFLVLNIIFAINSSIMRVWIMEYLISCFNKHLPWSGCNHPWNKAGCIDIGQTGARISVNTSREYDIPVHDNSSATFNMSATVETVSDSAKTMSSSEQYWQYYVLELSPGIDDLGSIKWKFILLLLIWRIVTSVCVAKSIKWLEKLMFVFVFIPIALMVVIWIRALTLEGATTGMLYYITPDFRRLADGEVWVEAAFMSFYTLGPAWGFLPMLGSHNKFTSKCYQQSIVVTILDTFSALMNGLICFSVLGVMSHEAGVELENVVTSGMSLGFTVYPVALSYFPLPQIWSALFFINLLVVGLDSQTIILEVVLDCIQDLWSKKVKGCRRLVVLVFLNSFLFLMTFPHCTQGGAYVFQLTDWYAMTWSAVFVAFIQCFVFMWIYGGDRINRDIEIMLGRPLPAIMRITGAFFTPGIILFLLVLSFIRYKPPTFGAYNYPSFAQIIGWCLAVLMICPIFIVFLVKLWKAPGSFTKKLLEILKPSKNWGPNHTRSRQNYMAGHQQKRTPLSVFMFNLTGKNLEGDSFEIHNELVTLSKSK